MNDKITIDRSTVEAVDATIRNRETRKVLAENPPQVLLSADQVTQYDQWVAQAIEVSGWAPFHYDRKKNDVAEPWRYTLFHHAACQALADRFFDLFTDVKPTNKIPKMLRACGALVLVTWLPEEDKANEKIELVNQEHLAAAAAATQNLLLALEVRGFGTYWSSGGLLGTAPFYEQYGIEPSERLIAAVFVNYPGMFADESCQTIPGKNREKRSPWQSWTRVIE